MMERDEVDAYVKAGEIAKEIKSFARGMIKPGIKLIDLADAIDEKIFELGGEIAFPVNLSLNEIAAHFTPEPGCEIVAEGILKVDIGVAVDGFIADTAFSVDLTKGGEHKEMIGLNEKILKEVSGIVKPGVKICDIGNAAQDVLENHDGNFSIIKGLSGHALAQDNIHAGLTISNYRNDNHTELEGAFAIEPFVTSGAGDIYEGEAGGIFVLQSDGQVRNREAREILKFIRENFGTLPFCLRFLVEKSRAPVSQAENTFIVDGDEVICTTA
jgi:methionyl aminopeptidase